MKNQNKIICYVIDDEPKAIVLFERLLEIVVPEWEITTFTTSKQLIHQCGLCPPDVLFSDIEMPDMSGFDILEELKKISINPITVFVTGFDHYAVKAIKEAVLDYLVKPVDIDELRETVDRIKSKFNTPTIAFQIDKIEELTPTEKEVLKLLAKGCTSSKVADALNCSPHTINTHRNHILQKMGCKSILEVVDHITRLKP